MRAVQHPEERSRVILTIVAILLVVGVPLGAYLMHSWLRDRKQQEENRRWRSERIPAIRRMADQYNSALVARQAALHDQLLCRSQLKYLQPGGQDAEETRRAIEKWTTEYERDQRIIREADDVLSSLERTLTERYRVKQTTIMKMASGENLSEADLAEEQEAGKR